MPIFFAVVAVIFALVSWLGVGILWIGVTSQKINAPAFMAQMQKLIMANNIDRAIKLCNASPGALLPQACKTLLCRANRPYSLNMLWHEVQLDVFKGVRTKHKWSLSTGAAAYLAMVLFMACSFVYVASGAAAVVIGCSMVAVVVAHVARQGVGHRFMHHMIECRAETLRLRNLLYSRAKYTPPEDRELTKMTDDEVAAWRAGVLAVEDEAEKVGPGTASDLYDDLADSDGKVMKVLPPL